MEFEKVRAITAKILKLNEADITRETEFIGDLGADSLDIASIIMELEDSFDLEISDEALETIVTVGDAADRLYEARN